jgi:hypothetical protein
MPGLSVTSPSMIGVDPLDFFRRQLPDYHRPLAEIPNHFVLAVAAAFTNFTLTICRLQFHMSSPPPEASV